MQSKLEFNCACYSLALTCLVGIFGPRNVVATQPSQPNIVVFFIDDMGWSDLSCFGSTKVQTENIDRLAAEGLRFHQFYVNSPICSPSRTALTTGQYPQRWRITSYLNNRNDNNRRGVANWLDLEADTVAEILSRQGYTAGHFGKWHMGGQRDVGEAPLITEYGFAASLTNFEGLGARLLPLCYTYDGSEPKRHALGSDKLGRGEITWMDRAVITTGFIDAAIEFMDEAAASQKPFYVNIWPDDVHSPFFPPQALRGDASKEQLYLGVVKAMDQQFGKIMDYIRSSPTLAENTILMLCSDNGPEPGAGSALPLKGHKTNLYEGGIRSPLIVWAPQRMSNKTVGSVNRTSVFSAIDLARSILDLAGVEESQILNPMDGQVLSQTLLGHESASRQSPIFWRRPPDRPGNKLENYPDLAIRLGKWKLLIEYDGSMPQLYDLEDDMTESNNLADAHSARVAELRERLLSWHASMPPDNGPQLEEDRFR
ncbi:MAG: sulfatase-like hydrolase/transferase [Planctomycetales bacterium]|nr:sulfatase-like hydrolase/transferase [Planctomycetales bacterium]